MFTQSKGCYISELINPLLGQKIFLLMLHLGKNLGLNYYGKIPDTLKVAFFRQVEKVKC